MSFKVSVIVPAYNSEETLNKCLDSAFNQTVAPYEVIVINDGSTDSTSTVINRYGQRIISLEQENLGQGAARNAGLEIASGDYIAFLDADDYWRPGFLETCLSFIEKHQDCIAVSTGLVLEIADGSENVLPEIINRNTSELNEVVLDNFFKFWAENDHVRTGSNIILKSIIDKAGPQRADLRVSQDLEYWGYIATFGKWGFIPKPLWVGTSRVAAKKSGWREKYKKRRRLCPSVEEWERRLLPRIENEDLPYFNIVRGRVAAGYAHNKVLAGDKAKALDIYKKYGCDMPSNRVTKLMRFGYTFGQLGWLLICEILKFRESLKG